MEPRHHFRVQLDALYQQILRLGALVEEALNKAIAALSTRDIELARAVMEGDAEIDSLNMYIDDEATRIIAMEQPVATDLRELITSTKLSAELERIGDHARHLARVVDKVPAEVLAPALPRIRTMAEIGVTMVHDALTAFVEQDAGKATEIAARDDEIDRVHQLLYQELIESIQKQPENVSHGVNLLFLNRFLERLGDHVTNMCEWVIFAKTGEHVELNK